MKPADHPEFYRFVAPGGRSRESGITLDARGRFWHGGEEIVHAGMRQAFFRWLRKHPDDGRYILSNGYDWVYLSVDGPPLWVEQARAETTGVVLTLSDGSEQPLRAPLWLAPDGALTVWVAREGGLFARFRQQVQAGLGELLHEAGGAFAVGTREHMVPVLPSEP